MAAERQSSQEGFGKNQVSNAEALAGTGVETVRNITEVEYASARITTANIYYPMTIYLSLF